MRETRKRCVQTFSKDSYHRRRPPRSMALPSTVRHAWWTWRGHKKCVVRNGKKSSRRLMQGSNSPTEEAVGAAPEFRALRRDLHAHPELGFDVHRTARIVADKLREWGVSVTPDVGISGVVGSITAGASRRSIGLRADMDALPVHEANEFAHRSTHQGRMHACGHDGHTVMLLAAAQYLSRTRQFDGTVHLIFQPAEEGGAAGARKMIDDGLFERFPCDAVFGMHNWPGLPVGRFAVARGPMMASTAQFEISVNGRGGHAAMPHNAIDPIAVAAQIYGALQTVISRRRKPIDPAVLSVSQFNAGSTVNVVPETAVLRDGQNRRVNGLST